MERLTFYLMKGSENDGYYVKPGVSKQQVVDRLAELENIADLAGGMDNLRELAKADKEGKVVTLPCKVGDTVYRIWEGVDVETEGGVLSCWEVEHIEIYADEILFVDNNDNTFTEKDIGKTVFLTKEEAESRVKRRR